MGLSVFEAARDAPDTPALIADGRTLTWAGLADRVRAAVAWLCGAGLDRADLVALETAHDTDTIEMLLALVALGVPVLPLHERLSESEARGVLGGAGDPPVVPRGWRGEPVAPTSPPAAAGEPPAPPDDERALAILHTSGTTGSPRGVVLSRRAFVASAEASAANLGWEPDDRWLLRIPVAHVGGLSVVTRCLLARRTVVLSDDAGPAALLDTIERERVTILSLVPTLLQRVLDLHPPRGAPAHVRGVLLGGAPASAALLERAADAGWPVLTTYGLTEACSQVATQPYGTVNRGELGVGPPLPGTEVRIGDDGAILVRGPTLLSGYFPPGVHGAPLAADGWLDTGDIGRLDDRGNLHVLGRRGDRIITGGENVEPAEVERALLAHPDIADACVFGVPDAEWGEVVCVALVADGEATARAALAAVAGRLASFRRPRRFAVLDAIPRNAGGKVDRGAVVAAASSRLLPVE